MAASGCGESEAEIAAEDDAELLNAALVLEQRGVTLYEAAAERLNGESAESAREFAEQEADHAAALRREIEALGATPAEPRSDERHGRELGLEKIESDEELIQLAVDLQNAAVAVYVEGVASLSSPELRQLAFEIGANSAAQVSLLLGELGEAQVPDAFVVGEQA